ncbi:MAG: MFS transporter [Negativicutes bacterium]|jgi:MFS family permease
MIAKLSLKKPNTVTLLMLISYATVSAVLFAPGLPDMSVFFAVSAASIQFAVVAFLVAYSVGQLFYGILSNRFGRKITIYGGLLTGVFGTALCILSGWLYSFGLLLAGRFIEALGAGVGLALTFIIINDYYLPEQAVKITAWAAIAFAISPGISSTIGGILVAHLGWQYCFWFLALYGLLIIALCVKLPETFSAGQRAPVNFTKIFADYKIAFTNKQLMAFSILVGATSAVLYVFLSVTPAIVINMLGVRPDIYGMLNLILTFGLIIGNIIVLQVAGKIKPATLIKIGVCTLSAGIIWFVACTCLGIINLLTIFSAGFIAFLGIALLYSSATTLAMANIHDKAYCAAAMSFINVGTACLSIILVSLSPVAPLITMAVVLALFLLVMLGAYFAGKQ